MPSTTEVVSVTIQVESGAAARQGFGVPMLVSLHTVGANVVSTFTGPDILADMVTAGFATTDAAYKQAAAALAQTPRPKTVKIGKQGAGPEAPATTMAAIEAFDKAWYGFAFDTRAEADLNALGGWVETTDHIYVAQSADAALKDGTAGNVGEDLRTAGYRRTGLFYHNPTAEDYLDSAMLARGLGAELDVVDGQITWSNKSLAGITPDDSLTGAERANVFSENANLYLTVGGKGITLKGTSAQGEFIDVQVTIDWLKSRIEEDVLAAITNVSTKIAFTQAGIDILEAVVRNRLQIGVDNGHLASFELDVPTLEEVLASDKSARTLKTIRFRAVIAGAIHKTEISGKVVA